MTSEFLHVLKHNPSYYDLYTMKFCHGKGNTETDGCCWVAGAPCPLRWKIIDDRIHEGPDMIDRGTRQQYAASLSNNKQIQQRILDQTQGAAIICSAAVDVLVNDPSLLNNRAGFNTAWNNHARYVSLVRPHWEVIEDNLGLARGSYQCSTWQGTGQDQCCFAESDVENETKRATLTSTAVTIRQAGGKA